MSLPIFDGPDGAMFGEWTRYPYRTAMFVPLRAMRAPDRMLWNDEAGKPHILSLDTVSMVFMPGDTLFIEIEVLE
jgi:hypothetical protein